MSERDSTLSHPDSAFKGRPAHPRDESSPLDPDTAYLLAQHLCGHPVDPNAAKPVWRPILMLPPEQARQAIANLANGDRIVRQVLAIDPDKPKPVAPQSLLPGDDVVTVGTTDARQEDGASLEVQRACDIVPQPVEWLWRGRIARGALNVIAGHPGDGKSMLTCAIAARVSRGGLWPVDGDAPQGNVLIVNVEDDLATVVRPRLEAAGADLTRVYLATHSFSLPEDLKQLERAIRATDADLVVLDPLGSLVSARIDSHRDTSARLALTPLAELASDTRAAILCVAHLAKHASDQRALTRINGSIAFAGVPRVVLGVGPDPDDGDLRVLASLKDNLDKPPSALAYRIEPIDIGLRDDQGNPAPVGAIVWHGERNVTDPFASFLPRRTVGTDHVVAWLRRYLANGPRPSDDVFAAGKQEGFGKGRLYDAKDRLGITPRKNGNGAWYWALPPLSLASHGDATPSSA